MIVSTFAAVVVMILMEIMMIMFIMTVAMIAMIVLRMILTLEGFLHLSISRLTISRHPWLKVDGRWCPNLQQRANPFEKQELGNLWIQAPVCDETQNLNDTDSETFFRYQIFSRPIPRLFSVPKFFETGSETFFGTKFFSRPVPIP